jgi:hypothetical protein
VDSVAHSRDPQAEDVDVSLAVLTLSCLLWIASLWSCRSAWDAIWERDWMELTWAVSRTVMLVFLAIAAGTAHAHWDEVQSIGSPGTRPRDSPSDRSLTKRAQRGSLDAVV